MSNPDLFETFEYFQKHLATKSDVVLTILKGHLLLEEQIWTLICYRLPLPETLTEARLSSFQKICLAESLIDDFTRQVQDIDWLWPALKKLNTLRNDIAHNLSKKGIENKVKDIITRSPEQLESDNITYQLEFALWIFCAEIHNIIEPITPEDFANLP